MKTLTIVIKKIEGSDVGWRKGCYTLRTRGGAKVADEGAVYDCMAHAKRALIAMYPAQSTWQGMRVSHGYKIVID